MTRTREEVPAQEKWNVEALYPTLQKWQDEYLAAKGKDVLPRWPDLKAFQGRLQQSPDAVLQFFDSYFSLHRQLTRLYTYAHLRLDEDLGNDALKTNFGLVSSLLHDFQLEYSWVEPELLSMDENDFQTLISSPELEPFRFYFEKLGRMRPHTLSPELEELLALSGKTLETSYKTFAALNNADLTFQPAVTSDGEKKELTTGTYNLYLKSTDRQLRKSAFENLHRGYEAHANTLCELIQGHVQSHLFTARARKFSDCREAALFTNQIDPVVYDRLLSVIHRTQPLLHEYIRLRKQIMKLDEIHPYDLYVPLVEEANMQMNYNDACQLVVESAAPLGESYQKTLRSGLFDERWVDPFETARKRSGAYSSGCYESMPYILMNYHGSFSDVLTLAHEAGHSMHSYLSRKNQPYIYAEYPIFVAEVASTFNEQLLLKLLKSRVKSKKDLAFLINYEIEGIRTTIFRQSLFAEFELQLHRFAEEGVPFTPALLKEAYVKLCRAYYGPDLVLDGGIENEWARIPHFYYDFYVYQYATGLSAALALVDNAISSQEARERYLQFLSSGGSRYPIDLLKSAGVDLRQSAPIEAAMKRFESLLAEMKNVLK